MFTKKILIYKIDRVSLESCFVVIFLTIMRLHENCFQLYNFNFLYNVPQILSVSKTCKKELAYHRTISIENMFYSNPFLVSLSWLHVHVL